MSHDLRTPLNAIIGFTEMMEAETFGPLGNTRYEDYAREIRNSGNLLVSLINDILDISKIEAGKYELNDAPLEVAAVIANSVTMISTLTEADTLELVIDTPPGLPRLLCDDRSLTQIMNNLLSNAMKFTPPGGRVGVITRLVDGAIEIRVEDTGIGMSNEELATILEPFEQAQGSLSNPRQGTGLGLHLCQKLMNLHDGTIEVLSEPGAGTTAVLRFPAARTADA